MSIIDRFNSIDDILRTAREEHHDTLKQVNDQLLAARIELEMTKNLLRGETEARQVAERIAVKLVTQFSVVEAVFAEARSMAMQAGVIEHEDSEQPRLQ